MASLEAPRVARLRPPSWRDGRLLVGVLLVLSSVALGSRVVAAADDTVAVYAAASTLPSGAALTQGSLRVVRVRLGPGTAAYLPAAAGPPAGTVLLRTVGAGEIVPAAAVGRPELLTRRPVLVPLTGPWPGGVEVGAAVDVWASAKDQAPGAGGYRPPRLLASAAEVFSVTPPGTGLSAAQGGSVQVLLEQDDLPAVLDAVANGARVALVPAPGARGAPGAPGGPGAGGEG